MNKNTLFNFPYFVFLSPVPGPFPLLLHLPNGQTMPVAIPASITSSNVHVPAAVPVSLRFRLFIAKLIFVIRKYPLGCLIGL